MGLLSLYRMGDGKEGEEKKVDMLWSKNVSEKVTSREPLKILIINCAVHFIFSGVSKIVLNFTEVSKFQNSSLVLSWSFHICLSSVYFE